MASRSGTLYVGVTGNLPARVLQHKQGLVHFTSKYRVNQLVYFEDTNDVSAAIGREKQLKGWRRARKIGIGRSGQAKVGRPQRGMVRQGQRTEIASPVTTRVASDKSRREDRREMLRLRQPALSMTERELTRSVIRIDDTLSPMGGRCGDG